MYVTISSLDHDTILNKTNYYVHWQEGMILVKDGHYEFP